MLPVTFASAEAKDSNPPLASRLPHSFSTMVCRSFDAIDITAALARAAMSRTPPDLVACLASAGFASDALSAPLG